MTDAIIEALDQEIARCRRRLEALERSRAILVEEEPETAAPPVNGAEELLDATPVAASAADESDHDAPPLAAKPFDRARCACRGARR